MPDYDNRYNEVSRRWEIPYGAPVDDIARNQVAKWAYLDEVFAN